MATAGIKSTTQLFTEINDITGNVLIMNDGSASIILGISAMNFGLLAEEEQDGVIYGYAALLNSLNYPIQIIIQSETKDVTNYLKLLKHQEEKIKDDYKKQLIAEYRQFVAELIREKNVLDKKFYVVVPASSLELGIFTPSTFLPGIKKPKEVKFELASLLEKAKTILEPKRDHLIALFARIGLSCKQLNTQEIVRVFYNSYNRKSSRGQLIADTESYTTPIVKARVYQHASKAKPASQKIHVSKQNAKKIQENLTQESPTPSSTSTQAPPPTPTQTPTAKAAEVQKTETKPDLKPTPNSKIPKESTPPLTKKVNQSVTTNPYTSQSSDLKPPVEPSLVQPISLPMAEPKTTPTTAVPCDAQSKKEQEKSVPKAVVEHPVQTKPEMPKPQGSKNNKTINKETNKPKSVAQADGSDQLLPLPEIFGEK